MFQRVWVSVPTYCHICIFILSRYTRQSAHAWPVYTRQISSPVPSINQSPYYVVHRFGFIANPSVNYAFPSVFQCRPVASYRLPSPSSPKATSTSKFPAGPPPRRRERDYLRSTRNWTFLTQGYVLDGTAISDVDKREIRTDAPS